MSKVKSMKIAITGTMASGKSLCSNYLRQLGYYVFDSDLYAKECYKKTHPAYNHIVNLLGNNMLDDEGNFVFKKVAELIFKNKELKKELPVHHTGIGVENGQTYKLIRFKTPLTLFINGEKCGDGVGKTKKEAEQQAAKNVLYKKLN